MPAPDEIEYIILHITASPWGNAEAIRQWHTTPAHLGGRGWLDIGYHYVVLNCYPTFEAWKNHQPNVETDGLVEKGRDIDRDGDVDEEIGAHAVGWNRKSLGVAMVGENALTGRQLDATAKLCVRLADRYKVNYTHILGHNETGSSKTCPNVDMDVFRGMVFSRIENRRVP